MSQKQGWAPRKSRAVDKKGEVDMGQKTARKSRGTAAYTA